MIQCFIGLALGSLGGPLQTVTPVSGMVITQSCTLAKGEYVLPGSDALDGAAITIKGDGITVDFGGAVIRGTPQTAWPDQRKGLAVSVDGQNVTIENAQIHGYKVGIMARNCPGLRILDADLSYNLGQRLYSTLDAENGADWGNNFYENGKDEYLAYGAAIYLRGCTGFEVKGARATGGRCGLMLTDCDHGLVWNCDFSFLSGAGISMFRSSDNRIMHNKVDWCVRGFSYGVFNRGEDSAGITVFELCNRNVFAYNSVTHGGDGFFLFAGKTQIDTGKGGCNDNLLFGNDFSHAPANGIEATFSRNKFIDNLLAENWHGIWGGYSFDTEIVGNTCAYNGASMENEHGPRNRIAYNLFERENTGVICWGREGGWGPKVGIDSSSRDVRISENLFQDIANNALEISLSNNFTVTDNVFERNGRILFANALDGLQFAGNRVYGRKEAWGPLGPLPGENSWTTTGPLAGPPPFAAMDKSGRDLPDMQPAFRDDVNRFDLQWNPWPGKPLLNPRVRAALPADVAAKAEEELRQAAPQPLVGGMNPFMPKGTLRGRRYILITEWGPYDFRRPLVWPREKVRDRRSGAIVRTYEVLGPKGTWRLLNKPDEVHVSAQKGVVPGTFTVRFPSTGAVDLDLELEYTGAETVDERGIVTPAGRPVKFGWREFYAAISWKIDYHPFDRQKEDPVAQPDGFAKAMLRRPVFKERTAELSWAGRPSDKVPVEYYGDMAIGTFTVPSGDYAIEITSDDGVRAWLDGKPILTDGWHHQYPTTYRVPVHLGGKHTLRVEHFQQDGYATLKVRIVRAVPPAGA